MSAHASSPATPREQLLERSLPHSAEAERAILGAVILDNAIVSQAIELLRPDDFYVRAHQFVFRAMIALSERGSEINPILLGEELRREGVVEQVGGISFISELTLGLPHFSNIAAYANLVRDKALTRQLVKVANKITSEALEDEDGPEIILSRAEQMHAELRARSEAASRPSFVTSFSEFMATDFADGERMAFDACRGEIVLVQSVTNHGKSTFTRNSALVLATGGELLPVVERGRPRRVLLLNLEGSAGRFQADLRLMTRDFTDEEMRLVCENLLPVHRPLLQDGQLSLPRHMRRLEREARRHQVDVIIIDTASKAFSLRNENDNAEVANSVMKPLDDLALKLNCLVVLVHHIGKAKLEEGATREQAHRGRGASAWGDFSASIFNLEADARDQSRVTLACGKRKNGERYERVLTLDRDARWFRATDETPSKPVTNDDLVLEAMKAVGRREMATADILAALDGRVKTRTAMDCLKRLADLGKVVKLRQGWWTLPEVCAGCAASYMGLHICTNDEAGGHPLQQLNLPAEVATAPSGGNGCHRGKSLK